MKINESAELHLFVIWNKGRVKQDEILNDLGSNLDILDVVEISWTEKKSQKISVDFMA